MTLLALIASAVIIATALVVLYMVRVYRAADRPVDQNMIAAALLTLVLFVPVLVLFVMRLRR